MNPMGRPRTDPIQVGLTLLPETLESLDAYAEREGLSRHEAARHIIELFFERGRRLSELRQFPLKPATIIQHAVTRGAHHESNVAPANAGSSHHYNDTNHNRSTGSKGAAHLAAPDPVFAAIEAHEEAIENHGVFLDHASEVCVEEREAAEAASAQAAEAEDAALLAWLTTPPTTLAGAIATLEYAAMRDCEHTFPLESARYRGERLAAAEQFPAMVAAALRQIIADKSLQ
jgi:hypothetical protein